MHCPAPPSPARSGAVPSFLVDLVLAAGLAACGGGGDGTVPGGDTPPVAAAPPAAAQGPAPAASPAGPAASPAPAPAPAAGAVATAFSLLVLDPSGGTGSAAINASGQVAWTSAPERQFRGLFFDGTSLRQVAGGARASATAVNASGQVTGTLAQASGDSRAFVWNPDTDALTLIDTPPGVSSSGSSINRRGQVSGTRTNRMLPSALRWTPGTSQVEALDSLGGGGATTALEAGLFINESGTVAGLSTTPSGSVHAVLWAPGTPVRDLGTMGGIHSSVSGLNDANQVIGQAEYPAGILRAFRWTEAGGMQDLGTLGGTQSSAHGINAGGWIAGASTDAEGNLLAFLWRDGAMASLGTLGGPSSNAIAINNAGQVAGNASTAEGVGHAFVWSEADGMVDLNSRLDASSPPVLISVLALADNGAMVVQSSGGLVLLRPVQGP